MKSFTSRSLRKAIENNPEEKPQRVDHGNDATSGIK